MAQQFTLEELKQYNEKNEKQYICINGQVIDVTAFKFEHPGGEDILMEYTGSDATKTFESIGHSNKAREIYKSLVIGSVSNYTPPVEVKQTNNIRLGWIGTGVMGLHMCMHSIKKGNFAQVTVYNRTAEKCAPLVELGAKIANSPAEVAAQSDIVCTIVGYPSDVREVYLDPKTGILSHMREGGVVIDFTTSEPSLAKEIYENAKVKGIHALDCPVSGGDVGAKNGQLVIFAGGDAYIVTKMQKTVFSNFQKVMNHHGPAGSGQHAKMCNQIFIASNVVGVVEGMLYAHRAGLNVDQIIQACGQGAAGSWSLSNYGPRILNRQLDPGFFIEHFIKDMEIALKECDKMGLILPGLKTAKTLYDLMKIHGHGKLGTHALIIALELINNVSMEKK